MMGPRPDSAGRTDGQTVIPRRSWADAWAAAATGAGEGEAGSDERVRPWVRPPQREGLACRLKLTLSWMGGSYLVMLRVICLPYDCCLLEVGNPCFMALERGAGRTLHSDRPSSRPCPPKLS